MMLLGLASAALATTCMEGSGEDCPSVELRVRSGERREQVQVAWTVAGERTRDRKLTIDAEGATVATVPGPPWTTSWTIGTEAEDEM